MTEPNQSNDVTNDLGEYGAIDFAQFILSLPDPVSGEDSPTPIADEFGDRDGDKDDLGKEYLPVIPNWIRNHPRNLSITKKDKADKAYSVESENESEKYLVQLNHRQYFIQKYHIVYWFTYRNKHAKHGDNYCYDSASEVYYKMSAPGALLWIAQRVGVDTKTIERARNAAGGKYKMKNVKTQSADIRGIIPFKRILLHIQKHYLESMTRINKSLISIDTQKKYIRSNH